MPKVKYLLIAFCINACWIISTPAAEGHLDVKTGLWEVTMSGHATGTLPIPTDELDQLPPEQRARIEQAMKSSADLLNRTHVYKECLTEEQLKSGFNINSDDKDCTETVHSSTAKVMDIGVECGGEQKASGTIRFEAISSEKIKGNFHMIMGGDNGMTVDNVINAKWLGSDCGDIKPGDMEDDDE